MAGGEQEGRARTAREVRHRWLGRRPDFRVCDAAHLQQRGQATWHDAQIRHTMDPPSNQDGRVPRNEWYRTRQNTRRCPTAHLDPAAPEASHAILCRVRVSGRGGAGLHLSSTKRLVGSARLRRGRKNTSITTKAWRHLSWTFEKSPRLVARALASTSMAHSSM